jgi:hypothetical protein
LSNLILVQNDGEYFPVKRRGRFAMELQAAKSQAHRQAAAAKAWEHFRNTMALQGFESIGDRPLELRGPYPHLEVSEDMTADPGPKSRPVDASQEKLINWERAERERLAHAHKLNDTPDLVDLILVGKFRQRSLKKFHAAAPGSHYAR